MDEAQVLSKTCTHCEFRMPETAAYCPGCGRPMQTVPPARARVGLLTENVAGAIAYLSFLPAILFLFVEPYRKDRFVRFHSAQCLLVWGAAILLALILKLAGVVLFIIPVLGPLLVVLIDIVAVLAVLVIWLVLMVKALQGEMFWLPVLGDFADRYADVL
jgi:uncharacterized membrane protein